MSILIAALLAVGTMEKTEARIEALIESPKEAPYGTWESPITGDLVTQGAKRFGNIVIDGDTIYWTEQRPEENGRTLIVNEKGDCTPPAFSVRTRVYEYGGLAFAVKDKVIYFVNDSDQRIYVQKEGIVTPLTEPGVRYGDLLVTPYGLVAVAEQGNDVFLSLIDKEKGKMTPLATGRDFYSSPALSSDGKKLAWLSWSLPNMPWDGTELWVAGFEGGKLKDPCKLTGGSKESIFQPECSPSGVLHFLSDKTGWWNLYQLKSNGEIENLCKRDAEFGIPQWLLGMSTYGFVDNQILCTYFQNGKGWLALLNKELKNLAVRGDYHTQIRCGKNFAAYISASPTESPSIVRLDFPSLKETTLASTQKYFNDADYFSIAEPISFPSTGGRTAYGFYYPPKNKNFTGLKGSLPPLIVKVHGGPTAQVTGSFNLAMQYWTSRGFAVLDVNYGGSSGYGRAFRDSLKNNWGIVDVQDSEAGALYLVKKGLVDPKKCIITGGSAGGYTTLMALATDHTFAAGASYFGVTDLEALVKDTHKFESGYLEDLIGPYPARKDLYDARSPIYLADKIHSPVIFFQGREDKVVPVAQAQVMYDALKKKEITTKLIIYDGEQHGFRKAENIRNSLEEELAFYQKVLSLKRSP